MCKNSIKVEPNMEDMPSFYLLPKLHKNHYEKRFIAASRKFTTNALSKLLTTCFTTITTRFEEYCHGIYNNTGVNCFWIINNSQQVLDKLHTINHF